MINEVNNVFHKVEKVEILEKYVLNIIFENGVHKCYDIKPLFEKWENFRDLETIEGLFEQVKVDQGGYGISWNDELDLSCEELWNNGKD